MCAVTHPMHALVQEDGGAHLTVSMHAGLVAPRAALALGSFLHPRSREVVNRSEGHRRGRVGGGGCPHIHMCAGFDEASPSQSKCRECRHGRSCVWALSCMLTWVASCDSTAPYTSHGTACGWHCGEWIGTLRHPCPERTAWYSPDTLQPRPQTTVPCAGMRTSKTPHQRPQ